MSVKISTFSAFYWLFWWWYGRKRFRFQIGGQLFSINLGLSSFEKPLVCHSYNGTVSLLWSWSCWQSSEGSSQSAVLINWCILLDRQHARFQTEWTTRLRVKSFWAESAGWFRSALESPGHFYCWLRSMRVCLSWGFVLIYIALWPLKPQQHLYISFLIQFSNQALRYIIICSKYN